MLDRLHPGRDHRAFGGVSARRDIVDGHAVVHSGAHLLDEGLTAAWSFSHTLTPMKVTSLWVFCSRVRCGMVWRQGRHQVAQNSTT